MCRKEQSFKLPSNTFSVIAEVFVPYSRLKIGNRGDTWPYRGKHFAVEDKVIKINSFRKTSSSQKIKKKLPLEYDKNSCKAPQFMVNPSLSGFFICGKLGHSRGFKRGKSLPRNLSKKQHIKINIRQRRIKQYRFSFSVFCFVSFSESTCNYFSPELSTMNVPSTKRDETGELISYNISSRITSKDIWGLNLVS